MNNQYALRRLGTSFEETASKHWTVDIQKMLEHKGLEDTPVCIHKVRNAIRAIKPEAYTPQYIGLGPYHHWREELFETEVYKLLASKDFRTREEAYQELNKLVQSFEKDLIPQIRASYDRHLKEDDHCLAWLMVIDGIFLLQFLHEHLNHGKSCLHRMTRTKHLVNRTESAYHSILQDIMMFENQLPIYVLEKLLPHCGLGNHGDGNPLPRMLLTTCKELCPLKCHESYLRCGGITNYAHILEILYYLIVPEPDHSYQCLEKDDTMENKTKENNLKSWFNKFIKKIPAIKLDIVFNIISCVPRVLNNCQPVRFICTIITTLIPCVSAVKRQGAMSSGTPNNSNGNNSGSSNSSQPNEKDAPLVDEIDIPSVSNLLKAGIDFQPIHEGRAISKIRFDCMNQTLYLPKITYIDVNTEVIIRNLVAYEAEAVEGPLVLARYTELMNGIIDTAKDVKLLREKGIIGKNYLKTDEAVAQLWNGMTRSVRLSKVPTIDQAIKDVKQYFERKRRVRFIKFTKDCMFCGWKILMLLLALVLMLLLTLQSFCDVYNCPRALAPVTAPPGP